MNKRILRLVGDRPSLLVSRTLQNSLITEHRHPAAVGYELLSLAVVSAEGATVFLGVLLLGMPWVIWCRCGSWPLVAPSAALCVLWGLMGCDELCGDRRR